ncbi:MAG: hypothetical protein WD490_04050 [Opitutales bacterium]
MKKIYSFSNFLFGASLCSGLLFSSFGHAHIGEGDHQHEHLAEFLARSSEAIPAAGGVSEPKEAEATTGEGEWVFQTAHRYTLPDEALDQLNGAHGGFAVDPKTHDLYFGLKGVGLIRIGTEAGDTEIIDGLPALAEGNLHNTTLFYSGDDPWLSFPDNEQNRVHVVNLKSRELQTLSAPMVNEYYRDSGSFNPTDTEFHEGTLFVADGYSPGNYITSANPFDAEWGDLVFGGKGTGHGEFGTAHGIAFNSNEDVLDIADRANSRIESYSLAGEYLKTVSLPAGALPCDIDFYGENAVIGCLQGPGNSTPAPIYILGGDGEIISTLKPAEDLGIDRATHIHNASWWIQPGADGVDKVFIAVTAWNPGDFFILEQVVQQ